MNNVFRLIWNRTLGRLVVASEAARSRDKATTQQGVVGQLPAPKAAVSGVPALLRPAVVAVALAAGSMMLVAPEARAVGWAGGVDCAGGTSNFRIAIGDGATACYPRATAIGVNAQALSSGSIAMGENSSSEGVNGVAIGANTVNGNDFSNAVNPSSNAGQVAIGDSAKTETLAQIAIGLEAKSNVSSANFSVAIGGYSQVSGNSGIAVGRQTNASGLNAVAIGTNASANKTDSIALGARSKTSTNATAENTATVGNLTYSGFAGQAGSTGMQVSVGTAGDERQLKNVAAGNISNISTDAINGSQLHATNVVLDNVGDSVKNILGGNANLAPDGTLSMSDIGGTGEDNIHDAIGYASKGWNVQTNGDTATNVAPGDTVRFIDGQNIDITRSGTDITVATSSDVVFNEVT
ncbi:ESPR-type extended signal peptide-containing protein, partial [Vreelandella aquamarina]